MLVLHFSMFAEWNPPSCAGFDELVLRCVLARDASLLGLCLPFFVWAAKMWVQSFTGASLVLEVGRLLLLILSPCSFYATAVEMFDVDESFHLLS